MSLMRDRLLPVVPALLLALTASSAAAQTALQLRWELEEDVFHGTPGLSRAAFTLTNRDAKPLGPTGWAIYFNALHQPQAGSVESGFAVETVTGELHRLVPGAGFAGLAPGASVRIQYLTELLLNRGGDTGPACTDARVNRSSQPRRKRGRTLRAGTRVHYR